MPAIPKKRGLLKLIGVFLLFAVPVTAISQLIDFDKASAIAFVLAAGILLYLNRDKITLQKAAFPFFYLILVKTKAGLKLMDKLAEKYRGILRLLGFTSIGIGFIGMAFISWNFIVMAFNLIRSPIETSKGVAILVPFTHIPGIGYLSFWYFIIGLFFIAMIHEFAHGVMARVHNIKISSSGFGFLSILVPIIPLAFVEPDEKRLRKEKDYVQYSVFAAGPSINIIAALIIALLLPYVANPMEYAPFEDKITEAKGISFQAMQEGFPAEASGLEPDAVINRIDNHEIEDYSDFMKYLQATNPGQEITLSSSNKTYYIKTTSNPNNESLYGYLGVIGPRNEREIRQEYQIIKPAFYWLKGLFMWLFILNLLVGLINLLPIFITDGGRMFLVAVMGTIKDKKKAARVYSFVAMLFLVTIAAALIINYGSKLISIFI